MGDVSHIMPAIEANARGACGTGHGADYRICDPEMAYIAPAKVAAMTLIDLLADGAASARAVLTDRQPPMTKEAYLDFMRGLAHHRKAPRHGRRLPGVAFVLVGLSPSARRQPSRGLQSGFES